MTVLHLPLPPNLGNARMHWRTKGKAKKDYYDDCDLLQLVGTISKPPADPIERCYIAAHFKLHQASDWDNLGARLKFAFDWLTTRGYIVDDGPHVIIECPVITQSIDRKKKRLVLSITPL